MKNNTIQERRIMSQKKIRVLNVEKGGSYRLELTPPLNCSDESVLDNCERTGKKGAKLWNDTKLRLTPDSHEKFKRELSSLEQNFTGSELVRQGIELVLQGLKQDCGIDVDNENFRETPRRVARLYCELFGATKNYDEEINDILSKSFPGTYEEMVLIKDVQAVSFCPHHLLPVTYNIAVAYLPKKGGDVVGLSKLSRLAQLVAAKPALQEQTTHDIAELLSTRLKGSRGAACYVEGRHSCVAMRGVKDREALTVTSAVRGIFRDKSELARMEFFAALKK